MWFYCLAILEKELLLDRTWEKMGSNLSLTMLYSIFPFANIYLSVSPSHFADSISIVILELSFVNIAVRPVIDPITIPLVLVVLALKKLSIFAFPLSTSFTLAVHELSVILIFIAPDVMPISMRLVIHVFTFIGVTIAEVLKPSSFFYKNFFRVVDVFLSLFLQSNISNINSGGSDY